MRLPFPSLSHSSRGHGSKCGFGEPVQRWWNDIASSNRNTPFEAEIGTLKLKVKEWTKDLQNSSKIEEFKCMDRINTLDALEETRPPLTQEESWRRRQAKKIFEDIALKKERHSKQHARVRWKLEGDNNTRFFHAMASLHRRTNIISSISVSGKEYTSCG